jgi:hypothetical protein
MVFCNACVRDTEAQYIADQEPRLDAVQLAAMMKGEAPGVMVLVNHFDQSWRRILGQSGALVGFIEIYRDAAQRMILRINGDDLSIPEEIVSECMRDPVLRNALNSHAPALRGRPGGRSGVDRAVQSSPTKSRSREASRAHHAAFVCMQVACKARAERGCWRSAVAAKVLSVWGSNGGRDRD